MSDNPYSSEAIVAMYVDVISKKITMAEADQWASKIYAPENQSILDDIEKDSNLSELLDGLIVGTETHDGTNPLFTIESYKEWLCEYIKQL